MLEGGIQSDAQSKVLGLLKTLFEQCTREVGDITKDLLVDFARTELLDMLATEFGLGDVAKYILRSGTGVGSVIKTVSNTLRIFDRRVLQQQEQQKLWQNSGLMVNQDKKKGKFSWATMITKLTSDKFLTRLVNKIGSQLTRKISTPEWAAVLQAWWGCIKKELLKFVFSWDIIGGFFRARSIFFWLVNLFGVVGIVSLSIFILGCVPCLESCGVCFGLNLVIIPVNLWDLGLICRKRESNENLQNLKKCGKVRCASKFNRTRFVAPPKPPKGTVIVTTTPTPTAKA